MQIEKKSIAILPFLLTTLFLFYSCEPIGITDKMTGKEAKEEIAKAIRPAILLTLLQGQSSSNYIVQGVSKYFVTIDLLIPEMMSIDEKAYYGRKEVKSCADKVKRMVQIGADELAPFSCNLKPLPKFGI